MRLLRPARRSDAVALLTFLAAVVTVFLSALPVWGQTAGAAAKSSADQPLPPRGVVIDVDAPGRGLYKLAVPNLLGDTGLGAQGADVLRNDFKLSSLFQVLEAKSFIANLSAEGLGITQDPWTQVGAQGVIKGQITRSGDNLQVEMKLYELARGSTATLSRTYKGGSGKLRGFMHEFANDVLLVLTGEKGIFGSKLTFAKREGPGHKDVFVADFDGHGVGRVSRGRGVSMLPNFGPGGIWYSVLTSTGMFITRAGSNDKPIIGGNGLSMGVTTCGGRMVFSSTRDGNSEIYSSAADGSDVRRLTNNPAIDVSPSCGPGGQIAFVSSRHGTPQIFIMDSNGGGVKRVTFRGSYNQTPAWCSRPDKPLIAFTGRDGGTDVFTVNVTTGEYKRITQGQGTNKDPAFSPDCRMIAFASSRGGIFIANPEGLNQNLVIPGNAETVRWSR